MLRAGLTLLVVALALAGAVAIAQEGPRPSFVKDRRGDAGRGPLDVVRVAVGRLSDGSLRGEITMAEGWDEDDLAGGSLCLRIHARRAVDADVPDHLVCATETGAQEGDELAGRVLRDRANGLPAPVAEAQVSRPTVPTLFLRFRDQDLARPSRIRVSAESVTRGKGCPAPLGCRDLAPDAPGAIELRLRSTTDRR